MTQLHRILEASTLSAAFEVHHSVSRSPFANAGLVGNGPNMRRRFATSSLGNPNNEQNPTILPVSNCAGTLCTTNIKIGGQSLQVLVDSGTSDLFVESSSCDESCTSSNNSRYNASESSTFRTANDLGESIHGYDTLKLGDINIPNQVFALASSSIFNTSALCYKLGYLGLGLSDTTRYNFPSLLSNLKEQQQITMFSLYLGDHSDYETFMNETTHNLQVVCQRPPVSATSELTFGGVNPKRYKNCLRWHEVGQSPDKGEAFKGYWDFALDEVKVGSTEVPSSPLAMVDSSKNFSAGPQESGIKKYDKEAELKLIAEFAQLLEFQVFHGVKADGPDGISFEEKRGAGDMINLIEEKINRGHTDENPVLRARSVFNGRVQRGIYTKDETASPTVDQDSLFITCIVDAIEGRFKATSDVRGAYLNAKMKDRVIMRISGPEVDIFCDLDPSLREFVTVVKGKKVLYIQLDRAIMGA